MNSDNNLKFSFPRQSTYQHYPVLSIDEHKLHYFSVSSTSTLTTSSDVYKHGERALKWSWRPGDNLSLDLSHEPVTGKQLYRGGIKIWIYLRKNIPGKMTLSFYTLIHLAKPITPTQPECNFDISLKFTGWRAVWVSFQECKLKKRLSPLYVMQIQAPTLHASVIYFDLLRIVRDRMGSQSRDSIVPPINGVQRSRGFWQQTYRWSLVRPQNEIFNELELSDKQLRNLKEIRLIRTRLRDWYRVKGKSTYELSGFHRSRWLRLKRQMQHARRYLQAINITKTKDGFFKGPPLFSRNSEYGELSISGPDIKFGFMFGKILLPLALEYYFASRKEELRETVETELPVLNNPKTQKARLRKLLGSDKEFMNVFYKKYKLGSRTLTRYKLHMALKEINHKRFLRIKRILEYIIDQGWAVGSALGSLDHEMNRSSKGFVTSIFLLYKPLHHSGLLPRLINIMKWYLEFGELYQNNFEFQGTTADRLRTLFLYRLMCVLVMPEASLQQAADKLRDMKHLRAWYENALSINPALGGTIKPDYTGYHHKSFYPNDYVLPGLLTASHVVYLLRGTEYELSEKSRDNLRKAIHFMRLLAEPYAFPNSVTNANPTVAQPELICLIPAFAYTVLWDDNPRDFISRSTYTRGNHLHTFPRRNLVRDTHTNLVSLGSTYTRGYRAGLFLHTRNKYASSLSRRTSTQHARPQLDKESIRTFLRMFKESNRDVKKYLHSGKGCSWKTAYMHTLGSLSLLYELKQRAMDLGIDAEPSPQGNWAKNFAALSIHRRQGWVVTVKGFNKFIWGHESSHRDRGNEYGRYQSYGQLLIANNVYGLKANDIGPGWDWTRLPGTTTLRVPIEELRDRETRFYNQRSLCGAMHFQGSSQFRNGVFTMDFERPGYNDRGAEFWFKKSVFFYNELLVCIGSDVRARRFSSTPAVVETTLFQNMARFGEKSHSVRSNGYEIFLGRQENSRRFIWASRSPGMLLDVNQNGYYIPRAGKQYLNVWLANQTSGNFQKNAGRYYATAVLRHGSDPKGMNYQYAILVNTTYEKLYRLTCRQQRLYGLPKYEVLRQDSHAHVVKFNNSPRLGITTYGYSIFTTRTILPGPLWMVGDPCVLMVEDGGTKSTRLVIGLSYPQMNFNSTRKMRTSRDIREEELYHMKSQEKKIWVLLRSKVEKDYVHVYVDGKAVDKQDVHGYVRIFPLYKEASAQSLVFFEKLYNGFTTEVHLRRIISPTVKA